MIGRNRQKNRGQGPAIGLEGAGIENRGGDPEEGSENTGGRTGEKIQIEKGSKPVRGPGILPKAGV